MEDFIDDLTVPSLVGQINYRDWSRCFQNAARARGLWILFSGEEKIIDKPAKLSNEDVLQLNDGRANTWISLYRLNLDEYNAQRKRIHQAITMVQSCCDSIIGNSLPTYENPVTAWKHLETMYRPPNEAALAGAQKTMSEINHVDYDNLSHYTLAIQQGKKDIEDAGGTFSDAEAQSCMLSGLPDRYQDRFKCIALPATDLGIRPLTLEEVARRLLSIDYTILREQDET